MQIKPIDFVINRFNEYLLWTHKINKAYNIIVYNRGDILKALQDNIKHLYVPNNGGREAHAYLSHIVNNYDDLALYTFFVQGNPDDHMKPNWIEELNNADLKLPIQHFTTHILECDEDGSPNHDGLPIKDFYKEVFNEEFSGNHKFPICSQFAVSKDRILLNSKRFYEKLLSMVNEPNSPDQNPYYYCCERFWNKIFDNKEYKC